MRIKICGITATADALLAARYGADLVGLILAPSPRRIGLPAAAEIVAALPPATGAVLVFRDAPLDEVLAALDTTGARWVQLHGREPAACLAQLAARRPAVRIIKAWEVLGLDAGASLAAYLASTVAAGRPPDAVLLDAPKGGPHPGYELLGELARQLNARPPEVWCAGGLTPANVATAVAAGRYDGVDVAAGVEVRPGVKDHAAVRQFIAAARRLAPATGGPGPD